MSTDTFAKKLVASRGLLMSIALRLSHGNKARAEDLVQEAQCRAWEKRNSFTPDNFNAWISKILYNEFCGAYRKEKRDKAYARMQKIHNYGLMLDTPQEAIVTLEEVLHELADMSQRDELVLAALGHTYKDIARDLCEPPGTVRSRLSRGRERLRELVPA